VTRNRLKRQLRDAWQSAEDKGWHDLHPTFGDRVALIHSEASEALEAFRDTGDPTYQWYRESDNKPEGVPAEFADIVIRVMDAAEEYGINLADALFHPRAKRSFPNPRRPRWRTSPAGPACNP
jgi:hypothetical protein